MGLLSSLGLKRSENNRGAFIRDGVLEFDKEVLDASGMIVPDASRSRVKEEYRYVKRPLLINADGKGAQVVENGNVIMVTSSQPGEGKTFNAVNLALSIAAERDREVLLIDADVIRSDLSRFLDINRLPGLVNYLTGEVEDLSSLLVPTNIPSLRVLPAGDVHHLATELLASQNMRQLFGSLSQRGSDLIVIFDSPPLLVTSEACVLADLVGQICMVVAAEDTRQSMVKEALSRLSPDPDRIIGFVLNKGRRHFGSYDYYYYNYYYVQD